MGSQVAFVSVYTRLIAPFNAHIPQMNISKRGRDVIVNDDGYNDNDDDEHDNDSIGCIYLHNQIFRQNETL